MTRREVLGAMAAPVALMAVVSPRFPAELIEIHDKAIDGYFQHQITDPKSRWRGLIVAADGLHYLGTGIGMTEVMGSAYICPQSKYFKSKQVLERMKLTMETVVRELTPEGNMWLPTTNFNSPPDTAFGVFTAGTTASNAKRYGAPEVFEIMRPFLENAKRALLVGGVHTPNHRWMMCGALAAIHHVMPDEALVRRANQWIAEGIDQDADGQYTERSFGMYNTVTDRGLIMCAIKMNKPELFEPVRKNLDAMQYLMHADFEVITEISRRQDAFQRVTMAGYWMPLAYLAVHDKNGKYARVANAMLKSAWSLGTMLEFPELINLGVTEEALPENYERKFPAIGVMRIRRGDVSATILEDNPLFFAIRKGAAVINGVRIASAFFGKGQLSGKTLKKVDGGYLLEQELEGPYFQPFTPAQKITVENYDSTRHERKQSEVCKFKQSVLITETAKGFQLRIRASGTNDVPVSMEINFREGGVLKGPDALKTADSFLLASGYATYQMGNDVLRIGPGSAPHKYVEPRGSQKKLSGPSMYITGTSPMDQTVEINWA